MCSFHFTHANLVVVKTMTNFEFNHNISVEVRLLFDPHDGTTFPLGVVLSFVVFTLRTRVVLVFLTRFEVWLTLVLDFAAFG